MWRLVVLVLGATGCVAVKSNTTTSKTLHGHRNASEVEPDSLTYKATPSMHDQMLTIAVRAEEVCRSSTYPVYRKVDQTSRAIDKDANGVRRIHPGYWALAGGAIVGVGTLIYADADGLAKPTMPGQTMLNPDDVRNSGLFVATIGIPFLVVAVVDAIRLQDTKKVLKNVEGDPDVTTSPCHDRPIANEQLVIVVDGVADWRVTGKSDDKGVVRFALHDLPEKAFQTDDGLHLSLGISESAIGLRTVHVTVPKDQTATLLATLANDSGSRVAIDRATAKAAYEAAIVAARAALARCQREVDLGNFLDASACWQGHSAKWEVIRVASDEVPSCLTAAKKQLDDLATCVGSREKTDDEVIEKARCLSEERMATNCGPLDLRKVHADRLAHLDVVKIKARIDARAAPIVARREKAAADEAARLARAEAAMKAAEAQCIGPNILQVVLALRMGKDLEPGKMRACRYKVGFGTVKTTTRDGWMIVDLAGMQAAFKTSKRHADGSFLRTAATAAYLGLATFDMVNGGSSTIPTFKLFE